MNRTTCPYGMVDTCCENYNDCSLKDAEIKRQKWVWLTDDEIMEPWPFENRIAFARWVESKVREKNT